ncbi:hypothetical protein BB558_002272, partial [Smittium angustum]
MEKTDIKTRLLEPEMFKGDDKIDPERWLKRVELFFKKSSLSEEEYLEYVDLYLEARAKSWFNIYKASFSKWAEFTEKFKSRFYTKEQELVAWKKLQSFAQTEEDLIGVAEKMDALFKAAKVTNEQDKVKYFTMAVLPKYRKKLLEIEVKTMHEALELSLEQEQIENVYNIGKPGVYSNPKNQTIKQSSLHDQHKKIDNNYESLIEKFQELSLNLIQSLKQNERFNHNVYDKNDLRKRGACYYCKELGHIA